MTVKKIIIVLLLLLAFSVTALSFVQAEEGDNACYTGGLLDSRCKDDWTWICGYYLQQWLNAGGWAGGYAFPDWCDPENLLPPKPPAESSASLAGCYDSEFEGSIYYNGISGSEYTYYFEAGCSGESFLSRSEWIVEAVTEAAALAVCGNLTDFPSVFSLNSEGYSTAPAVLWLCYAT
jgi:hypothetical protein